MILGVILRSPTFWGLFFLAIGVVVAAILVSRALSRIAGAQEELVNAQKAYNGELATRNNQLAAWVEDKVYTIVTEARQLQGEVRRNLAVFHRGLLDSLGDPSTVHRSGTGTFVPSGEEPHTQAAAVSEVDIQEMVNRLSLDPTTGWVRQSGCDYQDFPFDLPDDPTQITYDPQLSQHLLAWMEECKNKLGGAAYTLAQAHPRLRVEWYTVIRAYTALTCGYVFLTVRRKQFPHLGN